MNPKKPDAAFQKTIRELTEKINQNQQNEELIQKWAKEIIEHARHANNKESAAFFNIEICKQIQISAQSLSQNAKVHYLRAMTAAYFNLGQILAGKNHPDATLLLGTAIIMIEQIDGMPNNKVEERFLTYIKATKAYVEGDEEDLKRETAKLTDRTHIQTKVARYLLQDLQEHKKPNYKRAFLSQ